MVSYLYSMSNSGKGLPSSVYSSLMSSLHIKKSFFASDTVLPCPRSAKEKSLSSAKCMSYVPSVPLSMIAVTVFILLYFVLQGL